MSMLEFLQGAFYHQPNIRLPFEVFTQWVQLEIYKHNLEFAAEVLVKQYVAGSTKFKSEEEPSQPPTTEAPPVQSRPWLKGVGSTTFHMGQGSLQSQPHDLLPLSTSQYYELLELLTFHINLPLYGLT